MTTKMNDQGPNIFSLVEGIDVSDAGRTAEVIFATKVDGQLATLTIRLSYAQAATLADLLEPFRKNVGLRWARHPLLRQWSFVSVGRPAS
jgi:hypothetical protein